MIGVFCQLSLPLAAALASSHCISYQCAPLHIKIDERKADLQTVEVLGDGWQVVQVYADRGISGTKGRDGRPEFDKLLKAIARREVDMVAAWSVDRFGRSLKDLVSLLSDLQAKGVDLFLFQQGLDTSTPSGRMMFPQGKARQVEESGSPFALFSGRPAECRPVKQLHYYCPA